MLLASDKKPEPAYAKDSHLPGRKGSALENFRGIEELEVNLSALAVEVYMLLKEDLRLEQERRGR